MKQFFVEAKTKEAALNIVGYSKAWAKIVKVDGGYMFFEYLDDYYLWKAQK